MSKWDIKQGEIYWAKNQNANGSVLKGDHPCVVISSDYLNTKKGVYEVIFLSSEKLNTKTYPYFVEVMCNNKPAFARCDQITTLDFNDFGDCIGQVTFSELARLKNGCSVALGINAVQSEVQPTTAEPPKKIDVKETREYIALEVEKDLISDFARALFEENYERKKI